MRNVYRSLGPTDLYLPENDLLITTRRSKRRYKRIDSLEDWQSAHPARHWKDGYSAKALALCWQGDDIWPPSIAALWHTSPIDALKHLTPRYAIVEHVVSLGTAGRGSTNDLFILAETPDQVPVSIVIEGKVKESLGETVGAWLRVDDPHGNRQTRLDDLRGILALPPVPDALRYQLLHRAASALIEAQTHAAPYAIMIVHSFRNPQTRIRHGNKNWQAFTDFVALYGKIIAQNQLVELSTINGVRLLVAWVEDDLPSLIQP